MSVIRYKRVFLLIFKATDDQTGKPYSDRVWGMWHLFSGYYLRHSKRADGTWDKVDTIP